MFSLIFSVVPQLKIDNCIQNNDSELDNAASKSAVFGTLHTDRPKVI